MDNLFLMRNSLKEIVLFWLGTGGEIFYSLSKETLFFYSLFSMIYMKGEFPGNTFFKTVILFLTSEDCLSGIFLILWTSFYFFIDFNLD